jgi:hypothetical protein
MRVVMAAALAAIAADAAAQGVYRGLSDLGLSREEWALMDAAGQSLIASGDPVEGAVAEWSAPSGARGAVVAERVAPRADGALCVSMRHEVTRAGDRKPLSATVKRCRVGGAWLISAE